MPLGLVEIDTGNPTSKLGGVGVAEQRHPVNDSRPGVHRRPPVAGRFPLNSQGQEGSACLDNQEKAPGMPTHQPRCANCGRPLDC